MKIRFFYCLVACLCISVGVKATHTEKPFVIPELKEWKGEKGYFVPTAETRIVCPKGEQELLRIAQMFAKDYQEMFGESLQVVEGQPKRGDIGFAYRKDKSLEKEGYVVRIGDRVSVTAPEGIGVYWATRTLLQLAEQSENHRLPRGVIRDFPDYELRGLMLDCGRKFIPIHFLQDYVKMMAYYKMNALQIHLNDNGFKVYFDEDWSKTYSAFRMESEYFPELTARDGFYTKQEFIDLQKQAEACFVEIIPEIDIPAHSLAFSHYRPELGSKEYGMDHLDLFHPNTYTFLDSLFQEYLGGEEPVFRGKKVHIGTDEYSNKKKEVVEKFRYFTDYYIRYVESFGKQACVWGALKHAVGETPVKSENVVMYAWSKDFVDPVEMAKAGYKLVSIPDGMVYIVPAAGYYYDYLTIDKLYEMWTPAVMGKTVFAEKDPAIAGGMFAVWNDHVGNGVSIKDIHDRAFPALQTLAVKMWTGKATTLPFAQFDRQRRLLAEAPGVNVAGRLSDTPGLVYEKEQVMPGEELPFEEIGYDYRVSFVVDGRKEEKGTELFRSRDAVFYLSDPIRGMLGFARDGYLNTFTYPIQEGKKMTVTIAGNHEQTSLYLDGKLVEVLNKQVRYHRNDGNGRIFYLRTLVFPLKKAGNFNSQVTDLKVYQE